MFSPRRRCGLKGSLSRVSCNSLCCQISIDLGSRRTLELHERESHILGRLVLRAKLVLVNGQRESLCHGATQQGVVSGSGRPRRCTRSARQYLMLRRLRELSEILVQEAEDVVGLARCDVGRSNALFASLANVREHLHALRSLGVTAARRRNTGTHALSGIATHRASPL